MQRWERAVYFLVFLAFLGWLIWLLPGEGQIPSGDSAIWLHGGLLMILFGSYWIEHKFTKPDDVVLNGLVVFISVSMLNHPPLSAWWTTLKYSALALVVLAFSIASFGSPAVSRNDTSLVKRLVYLIIIRLGNSRVIFSAVFILALLSYFDLQDRQSMFMVLVWGLLVVVRYLELGTLITALGQLLRGTHVKPIGLVTTLFEPNIIRFEIASKATCRRGMLIQLSPSGATDENCPVAYVLGHRRSPEKIEGEAIIVEHSLEGGSLSSGRVVTPMMEDSERFKLLSKKNRFVANRERLIGIASKNSEISKLYFEIGSAMPLEEGHLAEVTLTNDRSLYFQLVNGRLHEEHSFDQNEISYTVAEAEQLGLWNQGRRGFETHGWVVPENAPVFAVNAQDQIQIDPFEWSVEIGRVPNSGFPAVLNIRDLVLYHSAILGVTGSGKSFLAYRLIERCAEAGIKVICLDGTADYRRHLANAVLLPTPITVDAFLNSHEEKIGLVEFTGNMHPISVAKSIAEKALNWCKAHRQEREVNEPLPKVLLVFEEAHTLIPEWNSNPQPNLRDVVNATAQIVLQARKYGLGIMVVTQRTANVIKSILNQCNTIVAFQAFDETGFDFMKNYMGQQYVRAIPNLRRRQGVVVGKASVSDRPVIVQFTEQNREVVGHEPRVMAINPAEPAPSIIAEVKNGDDDNV